MLYLKLYAIGLPGMGLYNCGNGIMSAVGDTRRPLLYLSVAGVLNVVLNLFFVIRCHMAAEGVAIASVIAQCLSALLIVLHLLRRKDACRLELRRLRVGVDVEFCAGSAVSADGRAAHQRHAANFLRQVGVFCDCSGKARQRAERHDLQLARIAAGGGI